jgi:predicted transcriptional regulator
LLDSFLDGAVAPAVVHLVRGSRLSREQIAELKKILDEQQEGRR